MTYKVLIVDDSKLARMSVVKALSALHPDWPRLEAANADEALMHIDQQHPDIVLLDFNMPGKDGLAFAAELGRRVAENLRQRRKARGLSLDDLARASGVSRGRRRRSVVRTSRKAAARREVTMPTARG